VQTLRALSYIEEMHLRKEVVLAARFTRELSLAITRSSVVIVELRYDVLQEQRQVGYNILVELAVTDI
jgi:hypothetical protein